MKIESKQSYAIVSTTIRDINNREMRQMYELKNRINDVLASHKPNSKEKKYISDDDLKLTHAILSVFTKEYESTQTSAFDDFLKEQEKPVEQPKQQDEKKPIRLPDDDLYGGE
jgi:benzoyl-CoA reductase/2-hydroxyglutaryl-CoA dehydratase subunit BcrC/BadD/HgdB